MSVRQRSRRDKPRSPFATTALRYVASGLAVLPLKPRSKVPAGSLVPHGVKDATTDPSEIHAWAGRLPEANIGIATGARSGILVLDVDPRNGGRESLAELVHQFGELPETVTVTTGGPDGGSHFYFTHPGFRVRNVAVGRGLDVRGDGGYVVAPSSLHPDTGLPYTGQIMRDRIIPAPACLLELLNAANPLIASVSFVSSVSLSLCKSVDEALQATIPSQQGQRNRALFEFARHLKGMPRYCDGSVDQLRPIVCQWYERALPFVATKEFDETWAEFVYGWDRVKFPKGGDTWAEACRRVEASEPPPEASRYTDDRLRLLCGVCFQLQRLVGDQPFYLSCRCAGQVVGVSAPVAMRFLHLLVHDGVLRVVTPGTMKRAARYHYGAA